MRILFVECQFYVNRSTSTHKHVTKSGTCLFRSYFYLQKTNAADFLQKKEAVKNLIRNDELIQAARESYNLADAESTEAYDLIHLHNRIKRLEQRKKYGTITDADFELIRNDLTSVLLTILRTIHGS